MGPRRAHGEVLLEPLPRGPHRRHHGHLPRGQRGRRLHRAHRRRVPRQSIDFFGALRARVYDDMVKDFCANIGIENLGKRLVNSKDADVSFENPNMSLDNLMEYGRLLVGEQENVKRVQLADSYLDGVELAGVGGSSMPEKIKGE